MHKMICLFVCLVTCFVGCSQGVPTAGTPTDVTTTTAAKPAVSATAVSSSAPSQVQSKEDVSSAVSSAASANNTSSATSSPATSSATKKPAVSATPSQNKTSIVQYTTRPTYASLQGEIAALQKAYPQLIEVASIGSSVQGRNLTLLKVGKGAAKACVVAGFHSREMMTVSYTMRFVEEACAAYMSTSGKWGGYDMHNLLDCYTLYIVPLVNPDGLEIIAGRDSANGTITYHRDVYTGKLLDFSDFKANANGVNLNKNFPFLWNKITSKYPDTDVEGSKGTSAASEPETKALMELCYQQDFMWMISFHVRGDCVYWSDKTNPNVGLSQTIVDRLKTKCDFYKCPTSKKVSGYGGGFENWFRHEFKRPGLCVELMPLDVDVTPTSDTNHKYFDSSVRWSQTYQVLPIAMIYGYID